MEVDRLADAIADDRSAGVVPMAVVATIGTTSSTAVDPARDRRPVREGKIWLHVDAAYAGVMAIVPDWRHMFDGTGLADSLVVNPHSGSSRRSISACSSAAA